MPEVVIVGAGPVGTATAIGLVERGVDVAVLERRRQPETGSRSIGIHPPALAVLERLGCAEAMIDAGVRIRRGEVRRRGRLLGELSFQTASPRHPYVLSLPQQATERILRARLDAVAPGALRTDWEATGVRRHGKTMRLETSRGPLDADWIVAADGPHSVLRDADGIAMRVRRYPDRYAMGDATDETGLGDAAVLYLEEAGVVESFPMPGGLRRWVVHRGADPAPLDAPGLAALVRRRTGVVLDPGSIAPTSTFGIRHVWTPTTVRGRLILAGDAAHEISPIGGQGMTLGWLDAAQLVPALADVIGGAGPAALSAYRLDAARRQRIAARQAHFNTVMGRPRRGIPLAARDLLVRTIARPAFERRLARAFTMAAPAAVR